MTADGRSFLYDPLLDWIVLGLLALEGLAAAALGATLATGIDRSFAREVAAEATASADQPLPLSEPELADAIYTTLVWGGAGLAVAGGLLVAAGVWFRRYRGGVRARLDAGDRPPRWHAPLLGGLLATALLFVPFVQVLGGAAAGAVSDRSATLDGALAGAVFGAPGVLFWGGLVSGALAAGAPALAVLLAVALAFYVAVDAVLAAVGGLAAGLLS